MMAGASTTLPGCVAGLIVALAAAFDLGWLVDVGSDAVNSIGCGSGGGSAVAPGGTVEAGGTGGPGVAG